jgi:hypothetical protein
LRVRSLQKPKGLLGLIDAETPHSAPPAGYFESFADKMLQRVKSEDPGEAAKELAEISPLLFSVGKKMPFAVPDHYFESLGELALEGARAVEAVNDELENLSPVMESLKHINVYSAPVGYFEQLPGTVLSTIKNKPVKTKVVPMASRKTWLRLAAAAMLTGIIVTTSLLIFNKDKASPVATDPVAALSKISDDEMLNYMKNQDVPVPDSTVQNSPLASIDLSTDSDDAHDLLNGVSDDELKQYIKEDISIKDQQVN